MWKCPQSVLSVIAVPTRCRIAAANSSQAFLCRRIREALRDVCGWEQVKKFVVLPRPFTVAADELTVSLKLRRGVVQKHYADRIEALYRD